MIKIIYAILAIAIKDLEMQLSNLNLAIKKSIICFKLLTQKKKLVKQTVNTPYNEN